MASQHQSPVATWLRPAALARYNARSAATSTSSCSGASSTCQLTLQSDTKVTAEFQSELLALAPNDGTNSATIALNSTHLFWSRYTGSGSGIWAIPKKGGDAVRVATGYANAIVADDAYLYWTDASNLYSTPVGGGQVALLFNYRWRRKGGPSDHRYELYQSHPTTTSRESAST